MLDSIQGLLSGTGVTPQTLVVLGVGFGTMLIVFGLTGTFASKDPVLRRMEEQRRKRGSSADMGILRHANADPKGLMKSLIPVDRQERSDIQRQLALAGFNGPQSLRNFYLLRLTLALILPTVFLVMLWSARSGFAVLPAGIDETLVGFNQLQIFQLLVILVGAGFFGPFYWMKSRAEERRRAISDSFPNALDLIQISVEAGLGFDAAMVRVANELEVAAPAISGEFLTAQREIQAGRNRGDAMFDMAARTGVEEVHAFASVVLQSMQFGSSISETLITYATEMRRDRELKAQEQANKLPVKMSAAMASLMLPALLMLTLGPVVIRYVEYFANK
ncbi:type II secretion system F family protein [Defluviimonas sp. WL0050]|uniref:Type II secretion system F family protein n=1 Tax=Albidovulum litorale TaxID=2984134 RepID=A0ABT2ZIC0_9RHOB|nr:type II secretion system F family protein [Defluviimonas sp. WL0050]MCV2870879.1 type II secretion system F family protein [Defluviimonas sp. WL0050]